MLSFLAAYMLSVKPEDADTVDLDETEVKELLNFVVSEIQKLKFEHREIDDCLGLEIASMLSGRKQMGKGTKYTLTLKVQPTRKENEHCAQRNVTAQSLNPEICEADVLETNDGQSNQRTLMRSTCLQVEELQN